MCEHRNFRTVVTVNRLVNPQQIIQGFVVDLRVQCMECELPFEFIGFPCGASLSHATVNPTNEELRVPIKPKGEHDPEWIGDNSTGDTVQ